MIVVTAGNFPAVPDDHLVSHHPGGRNERRTLVSTRAARWLAAAAAAVLLTACGGDDTATTTSTSTSAGEAATTSPTAPAGTTEDQAESGEGVTVADGWAKATAGTEESSMTAVFGILTNHTDTDRSIVSAVTSASPRAELHEMTMIDGAMIMREVPGGIVIPAGGSVTLEPGGLHVMVMDAAEPLAPGDEVDVILTLDDESTVTFTALAKEFAGANEEYESTHGAEDGHGADDGHGHGADDGHGHGAESSASHG